MGGLFGLNENVEFFYGGFYEFFVVWIGVSYDESEYWFYGDLRVLLVELM